MDAANSRVTIHMVASLDGFVARKDGGVDWLDTSDRFEAGETLAAEEIAAFLRTIDCYVTGSLTYETALKFEQKGLGWAYGDKPVFVYGGAKASANVVPRAVRPRRGNLGVARCT